MKKQIITYLLVRKERSNDDVRGGKGAPFFRRYGRELVSETDDFVKEKLGGLPKNDFFVHYYPSRCCS